MSLYTNVTNYDTNFYFKTENYSKYLKQSFYAKYKFLAQDHITAQRINLCLTKIVDIINPQLGSGKISKHIKVRNVALASIKKCGENQRNSRLLIAANMNLLFSVNHVLINKLDTTNKDQVLKIIRLGFMNLLQANLKFQMNNNLRQDDSVLNKSGQCVVKVYITRQVTYRLDQIKNALEKGTSTIDQIFTTSIPPNIGFLSLNPNEHFSIFEGRKVINISEVTDTLLQNEVINDETKEEELIDVPESLIPQKILDKNTREASKWKKTFLTAYQQNVGKEAKGKGVPSIIAQIGVMEAARQKTKKRWEQLTCDDLSSVDYKRVIKRYATSKKSSKKKSDGKKRSKKKGNKKKSNPTLPLECGKQKQENSFPYPFGHKILKYNDKNEFAKFNKIKIHPRIRNWSSFKKSQNTHRQDKGYATLSGAHFHKQRMAHRLIGIIPLLADEEIKKTYFFNYEFPDGRAKQEVEKCGVMAVISDGNSIEAGFALSARNIDENIIYHLMFEQPRNKTIIPSDIQEAFQNIPKQMEKMENDDKGWIKVGDHIEYTLKENGCIKIKHGNHTCVVYPKPILVDDEV